MKSSIYYLRKILSNFTYGDTTYQTVKEVVVTNLNSMGVECSSDDGMTTLAGKILDIEPTVVTDDLVTSCTLTSNSPVTLGNDIELSCTLNVIADDDVDLKGVLQNATIKFYLGDTLLDTAITDTNGVATYNYTPSEIGTYSFKTVFEGTDNFDECESSTTDVTVENGGNSVTIRFVYSYYGDRPHTSGRVTLNGETISLNNSMNGYATFSHVPDGTYTVTFFDSTVQKYITSSQNPITVDENHTSFKMYFNI